MKTVYSEFQSAAEVIMLNNFNTVALAKSEEGVKSQKDGFVLVLLKRRSISRGAG